MRVLDAQTTVAETAALVALVQCIARLEVRDGYVSDTLVRTQEALDENRFIAARDGMEGSFINPDGECRVPARDQLAALLDAVAPHAAELGCQSELEPVTAMSQLTGARRQLEFARQGNGLRGLVEELANRFCIEGYAEPDAAPGTRAPAWASRPG